MEHLVESWHQSRNLNRKNRRETLIYVLGRIGKERLPEDVMAWLAENLRPYEAEKIQVC